MKRVIVALAFTTLMCAGVVRADTITIAEGTVEMDFQSGVRTAVLLGANTDIVAFGNNSNSIAFNAGQIDAFRPSVNISTGGSSPTSAERIGGVLFPAGDRLQGSLVLTTSPGRRSTAPARPRSLPERFPASSRDITRSTSAISSAPRHR